MQEPRNIPLPPRVLASPWQSSALVLQNLKQQAAKTKPTGCAEGGGGRVQRISGTFLQDLKRVDKNRNATSSLSTGGKPKKKSPRRTIELELQPPCCSGHTNRGLHKAHSDRQKSTRKQCAK